MKRCIQGPGVNTIPRSSDQQHYQLQSSSGHMTSSCFYLYQKCCVCTDPSMNPCNKLLRLPIHMHLHTYTHTSSATEHTPACTNTYEAPELGMYFPETPFCKQEIFLFRMILVILVPGVVTVWVYYTGCWMKALHLATETDWLCTNCNLTDHYTWIWFLSPVTHS